MRSFSPILCFLFTMLMLAVDYSIGVLDRLHRSSLMNRDFLFRKMDEFNKERRACRRAASTIISR